MARASFERKFISDYLNKLHLETPISLVICGSEGGAERVGLSWAEINRIPFSAWSRLKIQKSLILSTFKSLGGKSGSRNHTREELEARNMRMLNGSDPDLVLAFGGGETTRLLVQEARTRGIRVVEISIPEFTEVYL